MVKNNSNIPLSPVGERVIVMPLEQEAKTQSGIIIPDNPNQEKPQQGIIIALGTSLSADNMKNESILESLEVGQKVLFKKYANDEVEVDGKTYLVMEADSVLATIK